MDLSQVIKLAEQTATQSRQNQEAMRASYGAGQAALGQGAAAVNKIGDALSIIKGQEAAGALEAQTAARKFAEAAGADVSKANEVLTTLGAQQTQTILDVTAQADKVNRITESANLGNPLGLIYDIFYGDSERAELKAGQDKLETINSGIRAINESTQSTARTQFAIAEAQTDATVAAAAEVEKLKADEKVAEYRLKMATLNADMLARMESFNKGQLDQAYRIMQIQESNENRALARMQKEALLAAKQDEAKGQAAIIEQYNAGAKLLGLAPVDSWNSLKLTAQNNKNRTDLAIQKGAEFLATDKLTFGDTAVDALSLVSTYKLPIPDIQKPVFTKLETWAATYQQNPAQALKAAGFAKEEYEAQQLYLAAKKPEEKNALLNEYLNARFREEVKEVDLNNPSSLVALPPIGELKGAAILDENPFLTKYVKPDAIAGGNVRFDPGKYAGRAAQDVLDGALKSSDVTEGISLAFKYLYAKGPGQIGYAQNFGLPQVSGYNAQINILGGPQVFTSGLFPETTVGNSAVVDLADPTAIDTWFASYIKRATSSNVLSQFDIRKLFD